MPIAGHRSEELLIYHQGSTTGYKSSVYLIPDAERATVVLSNSISLSDCTGWVDHFNPLGSSRRRRTQRLSEMLEAYLGEYYN